MSAFFIALRVLHIGAGATALFVGPVALAVVKGGPRHLFWGKLYVWAMGLVAATAFPMAVYKNNTFLFLIGVFSSYLAFSGWRVIRRQRTLRKVAQSDAPVNIPATVRLLDAAPAALMAATAVLMFFLGGQNVLRGVSFGWVLCVFGTIALVLVAREIPLIFGPFLPIGPMIKSGWAIISGECWEPTRQRSPRSRLSICAFCRRLWHGFGRLPFCFRLSPTTFANTKPSRRLAQTTARRPARSQRNHATALLFWLATA